MEITNKVAASGLITLDLEEFYPEGERVLVDIKEQLFQGLILRESMIAQEKSWLQPKVWVGPSLLAIVLLVQLFQIATSGELSIAGVHTVDAKQVGIVLYGPYLLAVELASILLLAALVAAYHLGRVDEQQ